MTAEPLVTPRLTLAPMTEAHGESMWHAVKSSLEDLMPWMPWAADASPVAQTEFAVRSERAWTTGERWCFAVLHEEEVCGTIGIDWPDQVNSSAKMGYWMRSDLAGRGLMTEGASAAIGFVFDDLRFHRLELHAGTENHASRRVAEKLGFHEEGLMRDGARGSDGFYDAVVYGLLSTDPRPRFHLGAENEG